MSGTRYVFIYFSKALPLCQNARTVPETWRLYLHFDVLFEVVTRKKPMSLSELKLSLRSLTNASYSAASEPTVPALRRRIVCAMRARSNARADSKSTGIHAYFGGFCVDKLESLGLSLWGNISGHAAFGSCVEQYCVCGGLAVVSRRGSPWSSQTTRFDK